MSSLSSTTRPLESINFRIRFFLFLCKAWLWKNFEFLSPNFAHNILDLWNQSLFSLSTNLAISFFNSWTCWLFPDLIAAFSASFNSFLFQLNTILTLPKQFRFHTLNFLPHLSILQMTWSWASSSSLVNHTVSTISEHPQSESHIFSNLNSLENEWMSKPSKVIHNGEWSEESECKWWIFEPENFMNQSWLANPQSNLSHSECPSAKCFLHVNWSPTYLRSRNLHSFMTSLKSCIWAWLLLLPPNFSEYLMISLKSPAHSQGRSCLLLSNRSLFHASILLCVAGSP